jgi:hypothetical protein
MPHSRCNSPFIFAGSHWIQNDAVEDVIVCMAEFLGMNLPPAYIPQGGNVHHHKASLASSMVSQAAATQKVAVNDFRKLYHINARFQQAYEELQQQKKEAKAHHHNHHHHHAPAEAPGASRQQSYHKAQHSPAAPWGTIPGQVGFVDKGIGETLTTMMASPLGLSPPRSGMASGGIALKSPGPGSTSVSRRTSFTADDIAGFSQAMTGAGTKGGGGSGGGGVRSTSMDGHSASSSSSNEDASTAVSAGSQGGQNTPSSYVVRKRGGRA